MQGYFFMLIFHLEHAQGIYEGRLDELGFLGLGKKGLRRRGN